LSHKAVHDKNPISLCDDNTIIKVECQSEYSGID